MKKKTFLIYKGFLSIIFLNSRTRILTDDINSFDLKVPILKLGLHNIFLVTHFLYCSCCVILVKNVQDDSENSKRKDSDNIYFWGECIAHA